MTDAGLAVTDVADVTGFPEMMDGRVKTLHPAIHGGILAVRDDPAHRAALERHGIGGIDVVVVDLYPFESAVAAGADDDAAIEKIDVGGPAMIRAAAKNHRDVVVIVEPADYPRLLAELGANDGATGLSFRRALAAKAFARTSAYDAVIAERFRPPGDVPVWRTVGGRLVESLRYGENPHQTAELYGTGAPGPNIVAARLIQGKQLSFNNIADADAALEAVSEFVVPAVVIVKHANPCGVATAATSAEAYLKAHACDPVSAFGGIVALNRALDAPTAEAISKIFTEVVVAPEATPEALALLARRPNLRVLVTGGMPDPHEPGVVARTVSGGLLVQSRDTGSVDPGKLSVVTRRAPSEKEMADLLFAFTVAKHVKSNAIVYARDGATVGIGAGQMSRLDSARIAYRKAEDVAAGGVPATRGSVAASDAFFPFADGLEAIVAAGAVAVIQTGGSVRDPEVIAAADAAGIAMVFTGMRHFRH